MKTRDCFNRGGTEAQRGTYCPSASLWLSRSASKGRAAFSLVEVLCAILILGVGLAGMMQGVTTALSSNKEAELQTAAALVAAEQIEILRADGFVLEGEMDGDCGESLSAYQWRQTVTPTELGGLFDVKVVIEHAQTGKRIYELRTLFFDPLEYPDDEAAAQRRKEERAPNGERRRP